MAEESSETPVVVEEKVEEKKAPVERKAPVKRLERPDRGLLDEQVNKLQAQVLKCQERVNQIKETIEGKRDSRKNVSSGGHMARNRLAELRAEFRARLDEKNAMRAELNAADAARDTLRNEAKSIKDKLSFVRVEQIDEEIAKLEHKMTHSTINIDEERKTVEHIKQLRTSRGLVKTYNDRMEKLQEDDGVRRAIIDRIKEKDNAINAVKAEEAEKRKFLDGLRAKEETEVSDIPKLTHERNEAYEIIREARDAVRKLKGDFKVKEDDYYAREREWRAEQREVKNQRWEASQVERKERDAARKAFMLENAPEPFTTEIMACEQLGNYLKQYLAAPETAAAETAAPVATPSGFEGFQALGKKNDREQEDFWAGHSKNTKKGKGKKKKEAGPVRLSHPLDALSSFMKLKMKAPLSMTEVADCVAELKEKEALFLEKRSIAKAKKEAGEEPEPEEKEEKEEKPAKVEKVKKELGPDLTPAELHAKEKAAADAKAAAIAAAKAEAGSDSDEE